MPGKALLVGHCGLDSPRIERVLRAVGCEDVDNVQSVDEAMETLRGDRYRLVVGNRVLGADQEGGLHLVEAMQADPQTREVPVLVLSAYEETQQAVAAAGGEPGFGKDALETDVARERFAPYFAD